MGSSGYQFPITVIVHGILGHRAIDKKLMSVAGLEANMKALCMKVGLGEDCPGNSTTRRWNLDLPNFPEEALAHNSISDELVQSWARPYIRENNAQMGQSPVTAIPTESGFRVATSTGLKIAAFVVGARWALNKWSKPSETIKCPDGELGKRRIGRVSRRR